MNDITLMTAVIVSIATGIFIGYFTRYFYANYRRVSIELETKEKILSTEAKAIKIIEKAESKAEKIMDASKADRITAEKKLEQKQERLEKRQEFLDEQQIDINSQKESLQTKIDEIKSIRDQLNFRERDIERKLEEVAGIDKETALQKLTDKITEERNIDLSHRLYKIEKTNDTVIENRAREILVNAIHRIGNNIPTNVMTTTVDIPDEETKGKIIGREGRNIKAFERITGVDVLIDDVPGCITLSSFDPIRREIAKIALSQLITDGRIQPARIESIIVEAQKEINKSIRKMGEQAIHEASVTCLAPELISILGRLYFRTSYGQNVLQHSVEVANLAGILASEIGADASIARAGGLVHDIGKTMTHEIQGSHVDIGIKILQKYQTNPAIIQAMQSHHDEYPFETIESVLVQVADAISGARPGARRDSLENYTRRLSELESIATSISGVERAFAIASGREIRVLVNPEILTDYQSHTLARTIATHIEERLHYPGEIKVHVIRETRIISYAR